MQIQQNPSLTRRDLELLDKDLLLRMMRNRVVLVFSSSIVPWTELNLNQFQGMYYLDKIDGTYNWSGGSSENTYQIWFELPTDKDLFLHKLAELKLST